MRNEFTRKEKLELFLNRDGAQLATRVIIGGVIGAAVGAGAFPLAAAAVAGTSLFTAYAQTTLQSYRKKVLLDFYNEELGAVLNKAPQDVTLKDLDTVAKPVSEGGKGIVAIDKALGLFREKRNFAIGVQLATSLAMSGAIMLAGAFLDPSSTAVALLASSAALFYNEAYRMVDAVGNIVTGTDEKKTITRDVRSICEQLSAGGRVSSVRVFGVFVEANDQLAADIKQRFGKEYADLNVGEKRQALKVYEPDYHVLQITRDINRGVIAPNELGFMAYGQRSGVPPKEASAMALADDAGAKADYRVTTLTPEGFREAENGERRANGYLNGNGNGHDDDISRRPVIEPGAPRFRERLFESDDRARALVDDDELVSLDRKSLFHGDRVKASRLGDPFAERY